MERQSDSQELQIDLSSAGLRLGWLQLPELSHSRARSFVNPGAKNVSHPALPDMSSWGMSQHPYGLLVSQPGAYLTTPRCWPQSSNFYSSLLAYGWLLFSATFSSVSGPSWRKVNELQILFFFFLEAERELERQAAPIHLLIPSASAAAASTGPVCEPEAGAAAASTGPVREPLPPT